MENVVNIHKVEIILSKTNLQDNPNISSQFTSTNNANCVKGLDILKSNECILYLYL